MTNDSDIGLTNPDNEFLKKKKKKKKKKNNNNNNNNLYSHFSCKKLSVINGSPEHNNVLKLWYTYALH